MSVADLTSELRAIQSQIEGYAREFGLDFFDVNYELLDYRMLNQVAAYGGFPTRYPHWRFGMEYERLSKSYAYGLHRIYEMVLNTDPCVAYLLASNQTVDQKLVMAHVCGHADFFKNNLWFAHTNRRMLDEMANHAARVRRHINRHGLDEVERFLDACLTIENLIDVHAVGIERHAPEPAEDAEPEIIAKFKAKPYMDSYINPPEYLADMQRQRGEAARKQRKKIPAEPERDVLLFLLEHAPLENWQRDLLDIVREEAYYFAPVRQTKIINEGWASYAHSSIMPAYALQPDELIDYADHHAGTMATHPARLNPYKLGLELFRDIEDRWNRGAFGPDYEACDDERERRRWDRALGRGRAKVFEVRRIYNDIGFVDEFLTEDFAREQRLFGFDYDEYAEEYRISTREFAEVKRRLLFQLTNFGQPIIEVEDANYKNRGELYLVHQHEGVELDIPFAEATLKNVFTIWGRPVHVETRDGERRVLFSHGPNGGRRANMD
ncbi:MAG: SpoVR family protein [Anaerolineales bacterium]